MGGNSDAPSPFPGSAASYEDATIAGSLDPGTSPQAPLVEELERGSRIGRYLLIDILGRGAMGRVFRAYDPDLDRKVALKILLGRTTAEASERDRLLQEAKAMARIDHPNVVTVFDAGIHDGAVFIAMELVEGSTLGAWLRTSPPTSRVLDVLLEAARGLAAAHAAGVVHRDFKPGNVLVTDDGRAKVGDFGLAGVDDADKPDDSGEGAVVGTPAYMSPEHISGTDIDARSDQFSFGITLYEALHGERPFNAETWPALAGKVLAGDLTPEARGRRGRLDAVIQRTLSVKPEQRYPSMDALVEAVERIRSPKGRRWAVAGLVALGLTGLAVQGGGTDANRCTPGDSRIAQWWNDGSKAALEVSSEPFQPRYAEAARRRLEAGVDEYASRWVAAFDASCARVGPTAREGTVSERHTAECLENRFDTLRGLVEFVASEGIAPHRVDVFLGTLPALEECNDDRWVPYPADPEAASQAAKLHQDLAAIRRLRLADRSQGLLERAEQVEAAARELHEPYLLARALGERARLLSNRGDNALADAALDEGLRVALTAGHDLLAAQLINASMLSLAGRRDTKEGARVLVTMARGLLDDGARSHLLMGNIFLNHGRILRTAGDLEGAAKADEDAARIFAAGDNPNGVAKAGINHATTLALQGRFDEAAAELDQAGKALMETEGETSPNAFVVRGLQADIALRRGAPKDALALAARADALARDVYAPGSATRWNMATRHLNYALMTGRDAVAQALLDELESQEPPSKQDEVLLSSLQFGLLENRGRWNALLGRIPEARRLAAEHGATIQRSIIEITAMRGLFITGQHDELRRHMDGPVMAQEKAGESAGFADAEIAFVSLVLGLPPPEGTTWPAFAKRPPLLTESINLARVVDVLAEGGDPLPSMETAREGYAEYFHPNDSRVQMLDYAIEMRKAP